MLKVGVPKNGVKLKMKSEGLDPAILDMDPNAPAPAAAAPTGPSGPPLKDDPKYSKVCICGCLLVHTAHVTWVVFPAPRNVSVLVNTHVPYMYLFRPCVLVIVWLVVFLCSCPVLPHAEGGGA